MDIEIKQPDIKDIQKVILSIYKEIKKVCDENNIRFYAIGGTCIGAARHQGFIPWDDDLDIAMPNKDYERFLALAPKMLPEHLGIVSVPSTNHGLDVIMRVYDKNTALIKHVDKNFPDCYIGVLVDIMPLYGAPSDKEEQNKLCKNIRWCMRMNEKKRRPFSSCKRLSSKVFWLASRPIQWFVSKDHWTNRWCKLVSKNDFDSSDYTGYLWRGTSTPKLIFPKEWFATSVDLPFEDTTMRCPVGYHEYLTQQFGDYMQLPPKEEQVGKHEGINDLEHSYLDYVRKFSNK
ncbi:MAG: LicD family protein [Clostridia bacterium]|nr:LicD family protein [Clostridia bacterium]